MELSAENDSSLNQVQLRSLEDQLLFKQHELARRMAELRNQVILKDDCSLTDAVDVASRQEARQRAQSLIEHNQYLIDEIDAALQRLANGTYGVSETTGNPIPIERLMLVPWARTATDEE